MSKKIYIAGKISGECETPELMEICKNKFYSYSHQNQDVENVYPKSVMFYLSPDENWYTHGLFINREYLGNDVWQNYMKRDLTILLRCDEVHMLPDWKDSKGATIERQLALDLGIIVRYITITESAYHLSLFES